MVTLAHRTEVLDDHACDFNHKKMLVLPKTLIHQHKVATAGLRESAVYLQDMSENAGHEAIRKWKVFIEAAEQQRTDNLKVFKVTNLTEMHIYAVKICNKGEYVNADAALTGPPTATQE